MRLQVQQPAYHAERRRPMGSTCIVPLVLPVPSRIFTTGSLVAVDARRRTRWGNSPVLIVASDVYRLRQCFPLSKGERRTVQFRVSALFRWMRPGVSEFVIGNAARCVEWAGWRKPQAAT
jgi:hypothetical protein